MAIIKKHKKSIKLILLTLVFGILSLSPNYINTLYSESISTPFTPEKPDKDYSIKYIQYYTRKDYKNRPQNWSILQDKQGMMYVANQAMLMQFDGVTWREIPVPNKTARSLAIDEKGTVFVGGINEIGYLTPDFTGTLQYNSLIPKLDNQYKNFSYVWRTHRTKEGIYFCTSKFLFLWNYNTFKIWKAKGTFSPPVVCNSILYTRQEGEGLLQMNNGVLKLVPGGEEFATKKIFMIAEYEPGQLLIGTGSNGFYLYSYGHVTPFKVEGAQYIKEKGLSYGIRLSSGDFALATLRGGVVIIRHDGTLKRIIEKTSGLLDDNVKYIYQDIQGNLWLALDKGIAKIEYNSPISIYNEAAGLAGLVMALTRHTTNNRLYVGTTEGLYALSSSGKFQPVPEINSNCWSILSKTNSLLIATTEGVYQIENNINQKILEGHSYVLCSSAFDANRVWVGKVNGLASLYKRSQNSLWQKEINYTSINQGIITIIEENKDTLWLGLVTKGVMKVEFRRERKKNDPVVSRYGTSHGLPDTPVRVFHAAGHVMFATGKGIFRYDRKNKKFTPDYTLGNEFAGNEQLKSAFHIVEDSKKNIWIHSKSRIIQAIPQSDGTFLINSKPFLRIPLAVVNAIYPDPDNKTLWIANEDGLIRYDTVMQKNYDFEYYTLLRSVIVNGETVFNGNKEGKWRESGLIFDILYSERNIRFQYAAPFFESESDTKYQCLLEGYHKNWTSWTQETQKDFTNLDPGKYYFHVRAQNVYGNLSREDSFGFKILPPWYRTWWSYLIYTLAAVYILFLIIRWRSSKFFREKQKLELTIDERTKEINDKNRQLEEQAGQLKEIDRIKSRFFANISHEFRTPLTLIMGPIEQMLTGTVKNKTDNDNKLRLMMRNSQRLLSLINQLLELSRLESGKAKLQAYQQNIIAFIRGITASFGSSAQQKELEFTFQTQEAIINIFFDPIQLEEAVGNLLSNALKFTPAGGKVTVTVKKNSATNDRFPLGSIEIWVCDTGPGIPEEHLTHIFNRFFQAPVAYENNAKGSGIGLAIAREIVELHHGTINVNSREISPCGSEFVISLPLGNNHLKTDEIISIPTAESKPPYTFISQKNFLNNEDDVIEDSFDQENDGDIVDDLTKEKEIILVVEDSADMRQYIKNSLIPIYRVEEATNGKNGIEKALEIIPDLVISDVMMPESDGYELCKLLKTDVRTSHIPVILLTAKASEEGIIEGLTTGADDYIVKPFSIAILMARIKNLIDLRHHFQQSWTREMSLQPTTLEISKVDKEFIKDLKNVIEKNLSDPDFNVESLSKKLYMSHATIYRKIHAITGETPTDFIRSYRLKKGAELLEKGMGNILEIALEVGFSSANYFSKCFKKKFQRLPSEYQLSFKR